ncbi:MAG: peptide deformylase [Legionellales bacterium RIFCSPHIGHO2_12_FULL_35_11]|nr:MAG: peptide deformylase [Legionellales bacterium RIFCSPHIGHO2_12_FULL_35_11]
MTILNIVYLPNNILRAVNNPVTEFDDQLQLLIDDMFETMYHAQGVGLAAPQIGINSKLAVVDVSVEKDQRLVLINPIITEYHGCKEYTEGCLSIPGAHDKVVRADHVSIRAQDRFGAWFDMAGDCLLGQCLQHEIDHLNGKLFIDLLTPLKRVQARKRMAKHQRLRKES